MFLFFSIVIFYLEFVTFDFFDCFYFYLLLTLCA